MLIHLTSLDLVKLCGNDDGMIALRYYPLIHHFIIGGRFMSDIHQQEHRLQLGGAMEIALDQLSPFFLFLFRYLCVSVAWQIHQIQLFIDIIKIDRLRLPRRGRNPGIGFPVHQSVDQRRLPHVGLPCERDLRPGIFRQDTGDPADCFQIH